MEKDKTINYENLEAEEESRASEGEAAAGKPDEKEVTAKDTGLIEETGIIAKGTRVNGDISTKGHLEIYGEVEGNITARGNVSVTGTVNGDIDANCIRLSRCSIKANLNAREDVTVDETTKVEGGVICRTLSADGIIDGNIDAAASVSIYSNGKVMGDIKTASLSIEAGAELQGNISVVK